AYSGFLGDLGVTVARVGVDAGGNAYVTARGFIPDGFPANGVPATRLGPNGGVLVLKVPQSGQGIEWSTIFGGSGEGVDGMAVHSTGDVLVFGGTFADETAFPVKDGPGLTKSSQLSPQFFIARINGTPGNGGGPCGDVASCEALLDPVLPDPATAANGK